MENLIKIQREGNDFVIRCAIDDIVFLAENKPDANYKVLDKDAFIEQLIGEIKNDKDDDIGGNMVENLIDSYFDEVFINCDNKAIIDTADEDNYDDEDDE